MAINYGYYLPLAGGVYESVRFLGIEPKADGVGPGAPQKVDREGKPQWTLSALVRVSGSKAETEVFTLAASPALAERIRQIPELTAIELRGLSAGKWSRAANDKTTWSFQILGVEVVKA